MPQLPIDEIEINDALRELKITKFQKLDSIFQVFLGESRLITVDIAKEASKTLKNLQDAAGESGLDKDKIDSLKIIVARDYPELLKLVEVKEQTESKSSDKQKEQSSAVNAVRIAKAFCQEFFIDNLGQPHAAIKVGNHIEVVPIKTEKFKDWLTKQCFDVGVAEAKKRKEKKDGENTEDSDVFPNEGILSSEALTRALRYLKAQAVYDGKPRKELYLRVAKIGDTIYYDLTNSEWQAVKITSEGWSVVYSPVLFRRYSHQLPQVMPEPVDAVGSGDIFDNFLKLLNISEDEDNKILFKCYIISLFYYGIVHAALMLHGEAGAAKTAKQEMVKMLVDPSEVLTLSISYDIESMAHKISHNYVCFFDNISKISDTIQDLLCRAITGTGFMKRELFTADEEIIHKVRHAIGLTGVNLAATKTDLKDRGLIVEHEPIKNKKRLITIWNRFEKLRPKLLGYIFDILVKVLKYEKEYPHGLELEDYPRLADFAEVGEIASRCMGNKEGKFIEAFQANINTRHQRTVNESSVGQAIEIFVSKKSRGSWKDDQWQGTMSELLPLLKEIAKSELQLESVKNSKYWPQVPNALSRRINEINPSLRMIGIEVTRVSTDNANKQYIIKTNEKFRGLPNISTVSIASTETEVQQESYSGNKADKPVDVVDVVDTFGNSPISDKKVAKVLGTYVAFDLEWDANNRNIIDAVSFVDSSGNSEVKFRDKDFAGSEPRFLNYIMDKICNYHWSIGWNTQGNAQSSGSRTFDLYILHERCNLNGIDSIVGLGQKGLPYIKNGYKHIDLLNVYSKTMVKDGMYGSKYRTNKLNDVSKALLGYGKYKDHSGMDFKTLSPEEQVQYSLTDSKLPMELSKHRDFEVLDAMFAVAEITELDFDRVCRTNLSTWWSAIFEKLIERGQCPPLDRKEFTGTYKGAEVLTPKRGKYHNVVVVDAKSLYPSVGINYNLSFDTINCSCCQNNPDAKLSRIIPNEFTKDCRFVNPARDWICKQREGAFPSKLKVFRAERLRQKDLGNKAKQHALKILINGGYGVFGNKEYSFYDPRVAELVTAAGRYILSEMRYTAKNDYNFEIIYGDTDSLFLYNVTDSSLIEFQQKFKQKYDIELEIKNRYDKLLLSAGKKHYIGVEKGTLDNVGFEGEKNDRPEFFHMVYNKLVTNIMIDAIDPLPDIRNAFSDLDSGKVNSNLLTISQKVGRDPDNYFVTTRVGTIARAINAKEGDLIKYWNSDKNQTGNSWTLDPAQIDISKYKDLLWNTIKEILEIEGCSVADLAKEFGIKIKGQGRAKSRKKVILRNCDIVHNKRNSIGGEK